MLLMLGHVRQTANAILVHRGRASTLECFALDTDQLCVQLEAILRGPVQWIAQECGALARGTRTTHAQLKESKGK